jgi:lipopolysaccharide/colanic/teichoic acid biosynthesis glycosyltransferase
LDHAQAQRESQAAKPKSPPKEAGEEPVLRVNTVIVTDEATFAREIYLERRRAERSHRSLVLILVDGLGIADASARMAALRAVIHRLSELLRDTDKAGWYRAEATLGMLLPDLERVDQGWIRMLAGKVWNLLQDTLGAALADQLQVTIHVFPDPLTLSGDSTDFTLYPELPRSTPGLHCQVALKRALDVLVSTLVLLLLAPLLALLAAVIKCGSRGPALFCQERLGQYGKPFKFLKFRSMYRESDAALHENYVRQFIAGVPVATGGIYKIRDDPRVTPVGHLLRRTSLDELPQLWNVLRGEMSLVGPRPPLPYEFQDYAPWHRRRVLESKPGITGLWQVQGRSRTSFDEMVRLDLRYARRWSLWLDIKILWHTPGAVLWGKGAY